ncbi:MAG: glycolate oxidase subunit GlcE [Phycisphaerae bacterium]|nr:glycolate oxidase subunit GlcE [Phycisphaerae bacterium]
MADHIEAGLAQLREQVLAANADRRALRIRGSDTKAFYGDALGAEAETLDCRGSRGIVDYEPTELVITARCGTPLKELEQTLAAKHQYLPFEPPHFGPDATVGGTFAAGLSGPRRMSAGALRDYVLGAVLLTASGEVLRFGGQVMKNVAGYDVSRLLAGSLGVLGVIAEVSLKVLPLPVAERTLQFAFGEAEAISRCNQWGGEPLPISATRWCDGQLSVRLSGAAAGVDAAARRIGGEPLAAEPAQAMWRSVCEHSDPFFSRGSVVWRLSLPAATPPLELAGEQLIEWGGALRWFIPSLDHASPQTLRDLVTRVGGSAILFRAGSRATVQRFHPLHPVLRQIHQRLKQAFDPNGIMNPGRMYDWL